MKIQKKKEKTDKSFRYCFNELIEKAFTEEGIIKISTNDLRIKYIDIYDPDKFAPKMRENIIKENNIYLNSLKKIFIELSSMEPLYSKIEEKILDEQKVLSKLTYSKANLYICKIKKFCYNNQEEKLIKEKGIILDKKYEKDIELDRLSSHSDRAILTQCIAYIAFLGLFYRKCRFSPCFSSTHSSWTNLWFFRSCSLWCSNRNIYI